MTNYIAYTGNNKTTVNRGASTSMAYPFFSDNDGVWAFDSASVANIFSDNDGVWAFDSASVANTFDVAGLRWRIRRASSEDDWKLFQALKKQWHKERGYTSSTTRIVMCPSYQQIIGMGKRALPFILMDLRDNANNPDQWFWALSNITRADPIPVDMYGRHIEMARAWLSWADEHGVSIAGQ